jgi:Tol biopolymer transport system component
MHKRYPTLIRALALAAVLAGLGSTNAYAQKKPGGGGGGGETTPVPAGTIHFSQSTADPWYYAEMTMKADGSGKTQLGLREQGNAWKPSHQLQGGQRWFLNMRDTGVMNEYDEMIQELFAFTADGYLVQLTHDPNLWVHSYRWAKDDSFLSFVGYSYDSITDEDEEYLYAADVDWSSGSPEIGPPRKVLSAQYEVDGLKGYYLGTYDWSPAGNQLVYNDIRNGDNHEVRVATFLADGSVETHLIGYGWYPTWSPDGNWIAYGKGGIWKLRPNGSDLVQLTSLTRDQSHWGQAWSPDSLDLAFTQSTSTTTSKRGVTTTTYTYDVMRVSANGGTVTNLTTDTAADCFAIGWR